MKICTFYELYIITKPLYNKTKCWEDKYTEEDVEYLNKITVENQKMIYVPQIAEFLDNYQNNRDKYKTLEDFIPELEEFILMVE